MRAAVYYRHLTKTQSDEINTHGWSSEIGAAYLNAREGDYTEALKLGLMKWAAQLDADENEDVYVRLQNLSPGGWQSDRSIKCMTDFPRSMDIGDVIIWEDGRMERVASFGFEPVKSFGEEALAWLRLWGVMR